MSQKLFEATVLTAMFGLWMSAAAVAQTRAKASHPAGSKAASTKPSKAPAKLPLKDITFISTPEAAREAATATKAQARSRSSAKPGQPGSSGILEFHSVKTGSSADSGLAGARSKHQKGRLLKDFHGTVYGLTTNQSPNSRTAGGAVGAGSSNGKFNVFVETEHSHTSNRGPQ